MKIELKITDEAGNVQLYDVSGSVHLHCILQPHYDNKGRLDGGTMISGGKITGHIDPCGEEGCPGVDGITVKKTFITQKLTCFLKHFLKYLFILFKFIKFNLEKCRI